MPIRPENRDRYPPDWDEISDAVKEAAGRRCVCIGECGRPARHLDPADGRCRNRDGEPIWVDGDKNELRILSLLAVSEDVSARKLVVLTTAHRNHTPEDCREENLAAFCAGCHLHYDLAHHARTRRQSATRALEAQMDTLFDIRPRPRALVFEPVCDVNVQRVPGGGLVVTQQSLSPKQGDIRLHTHYWTGPSTKHPGAAIWTPFIEQAARFPTVYAAVTALTGLHALYRVVGPIHEAESEGS